VPQLPSINNTDVALIGAGPVGLELAVALRQSGTKYVHFDAGQIGQTIFNWPPQTQFFSSPERIAIAGFPIHSVDQQKITGEQYLAYLRTVVEYFNLDIQTYERTLSIEPVGDGFLVRTRRASGERAYRSQKVILSTGGMARARRLGIPGEDLPHVDCTPADPHKYFRTRLLIVGGRNSAVEAALRNWRAGAKVAISYRRTEFDCQIVKRHLFAEVTSLIQTGKIDFYPETAPVEIRPDCVLLAPVRDGKPIEGPRRGVGADFVLMCCGFVADMRLFEEAGVELRGAAQVPVYNEETMETNVPGLYVAGTATGGTQERFQSFIETSHIHVERIIQAITGRPAEIWNHAEASRFQYHPSELEI